MRGSEESLIHYLTEQFPTPHSLVGIGDDAAVIPGATGKSWLVTTDALVEGVHFLKDFMPPRDLGYKTIAVNVSDITAMGGEPKYAFLSMALPNSVEDPWVYDFIQGIKEACAQWDLLLLGGDTVGSKKDIFLNLTLLGEAVTEKIKYRNQAKLGDIVCVTSYLGDSGAGLKALQERLPKTEDVAALISAHFHPKPQPKQGMWLALQEGVHAMMDISDGLDCDLRRLLKSSQIGAEIDIGKIPISDPLDRVSQENHWDPLQYACTGGEDYCLLLTVAAEDFKKIEQEFQTTFGTPLFGIGHITYLPENIVYFADGKKVEMTFKSFDHFQ